MQSRSLELAMIVALVWAPGCGGGGTSPLAPPVPPSVAVESMILTAFDDGTTVSESADGTFELERGREYCVRARIKNARTQGRRLQMNVQPNWSHLGDGEWIVLTEWWELFEYADCSLVMPVVAASGPVEGYRIAVDVHEAGTDGSAPIIVFSGSFKVRPR